MAFGTSLIIAFVLLERIVLFVLFKKVHVPIPTTEDAVNQSSFKGFGSSQHNLKNRPPRDAK